MDLQLKQRNAKTTTFGKLTKGGVAVCELLLYYCRILLFWTSYYQTIQTNEKIKQKPDKEI